MVQKFGKKNGEDSPHADKVESKGYNGGLDYWPLLVYSLSKDHIREQKAMPSVSTSCMSTWVSMGIMTSASLLGSLAAARSSSKYCR